VGFSDKKIDTCPEEREGRWRGEEFLPIEEGKELDWTRNTFSGR